jgi:2'-5' RNA ligase/ribosomal protein S18 acetylase RimI-like enzyme
MPRVRLGVVLLVPPPAAAEVDGLRKAVGDGALGKIASHITLVPPVNVRDDRLMDALDLVRAAAGKHRPMTVRLGPVTTFLPESPTLYLAVDGGDASAIAALRDDIFRDPLHRRVDWPFVPHVTLADEASPERIAAATVALADYRAEITIDRVHLMQEQDDRTWRPIADAELGAEPIVRNRGAIGQELELTTTSALDPETKAFEDREWSAHDQTPWIEDPFVITARRDGTVVGVARGWTAGGIGELSGLVVAAEHRGEGIGSHLLAAFTSLAAERGCRRLALGTFAARPAHGFYKGHGWVDEATFDPWVFGRTFVQLRRDL